MVICVENPNLNLFIMHLFMAIIIYLNDIFRGCFRSFSVGSFTCVLANARATMTIY